MIIIDYILFIYSYYWCLIINDSVYYYKCWKQFLPLNIVVETVMMFR